MQTKIFTLLFILTVFTTQTGSARINFNQQKELKEVENINIYPNPVNKKATLEVILEKDSQVKIEFYDLSGQKIKALKEVFLNEGINKIEFMATDFSEGYYFCKVSTDQWIKTKRILVRR